MVELLAEQQQDFEQCRRGREIHHSYPERNATQTTGTGDPRRKSYAAAVIRCEGNKTVGRHPAQEDRQPEQGYSHRGFPYRPGPANISKCGGLPTEPKQGYNYLMRMDEYTGLLESMERMYKLMQNRALAIINIEKAVSIYDNNNIFKEIEL